jgi:hypothetical protein
MLSTPREAGLGQGKVILPIIFIDNNRLGIIPVKHTKTNRRISKE